MNKYISGNKIYGIGVMEVLVALISLGVSFVSVIQLQYQALTDNRQSVEITSAILAAESMAEMIYANPAAAIEGHYTHRSDTFNSSNIIECINRSCRSAELANYDISEWHKNLPQNLIGVVGEVKPLSSDNKLWAITVRWDSDNAGTSLHSGEMCHDNDHDCVSLNVRINI